MPVREIEKIKNCFVRQLLPVRVYLFGSYANGTYTEESDFDFFIIVKDSVTDLVSETAKAYKAIRWVATRSVDIVLGTESGFERRKDMCTVENEVSREGVLLYDAGSKTMA